MERDHDDADVARRRGGIHWRSAFGAMIIGCLAAGCPRVEDDDSATGDDDTTAGDDDTSAGDDDTTISPLAPCAFADLSAGRILVSERYAYDAYGDWAWESAVDAWIWPRPWSRNHGMGVFHWVEVIVNGHNAGHGLPLDAILHCVTQDSGSLAIPASLVQGFPHGEWLGTFDGTACEGMDCLPCELSRFTRHVVDAEPGPVELVVRSSTYFGWSH